MDTSMNTMNTASLVYCDRREQEDAIVFFCFKLCPESDVCNITDLSILLALIRAKDWNL